MNSKGKQKKETVEALTFMHAENCIFPVRSLSECPHVGDGVRLEVPLVSPRSTCSPLRYPGGKGSMAPFIAGLIASREPAVERYVEPYSGGAGIAAYLLLNELVSTVVINDYDSSVYSFWNALFNDSDAFLNFFDSAEPSIEEWHRQRELVRMSDNPTERGFAFFFLNRTNRSGVLNGGVIGGLNQAGKYKVNARYNKPLLREKLTALQEKADRVIVRNEDGASIIEEYGVEKTTFIYADPPYVKKGKSLYMNHFEVSDHRSLAGVMSDEVKASWVLTYDDAPLIRDLYANQFGGRFALGYSAFARRSGEELLIVSKSLSAQVAALKKEGAL